MENKTILQTSNLRTIWNACDDALQYQKLNVGYGIQGLGKSTALSNYRDNHKNNVIYIQMERSYTPKLFFSSIYNEIDSENYSDGLNIHIAIRQAANVFRSKSQNMLLIIDQANKMSTTMLEYIQELKDLTRENTGIVIAGTDRLKLNLDNWNRRKINGIPEFYSRIDAWFELSSPVYDEIVTIIRSRGINDLKFENQCLNVKTFRELDTLIKNYISLTAKTMAAKNNL